MPEKELVERAIQANKEHQAALRQYAERLEAELAAADRMIAAIGIDEDDNVDPAVLISVAGASRPVPLILPKALHSEDSPFHEDAKWKKRYDDLTTINQPKAKDDEALREAVRIENIRKHTLESQLRQQNFKLSSFPPGHFEQNTENLDWRRVAVNSTKGVTSTRSAEECEIRWKGYLHPSINHESWSTEEVEKLRAIITAEPKPIRWTKVAKALGTNRTPIDCMRNGVPRKIHSWDDETDRRLLEVVDIYGVNNWQLVAANVSEDATGAQCQKRFLDSIDPDIIGGPWSAEDDEKLVQAVTAFTTVSNGSTSKSVRKAKTGISWPDVALFVPGRTNNQCRERFERLSGIRGRKPAQERNVKGKEKASANDEARDSTSADSTEKAPTHSGDVAASEGSSVTQAASEPDRRKRKPSSTHLETRKAAEDAPGKKRKVGRPRKSAQLVESSMASGDSIPQMTTVYIPSMLPATLHPADSEGSRRRSSRLATRS